MPIVSPPRQGRSWEWCSIAILLSVGLRASEFDIVIDEIAYNPLSGLEADEFVELHNRGPTPVDLGGWAFTEGISFLLPPETTIGPREFVVVAADPARMADLVPAGTAVLGPFTGQLDNGGEIVGLVSPSGESICRVHYGDGGSWPSAPDGLGPTLELLDPRALVETPRSWARSLRIGGTPGALNSVVEGEPTGRSLVINEVRETSGAGAGFVELYNRGSSSRDLSGLAILDSRGWRHDLPAGLNLPPGGFLSLSDASLGRDLALGGRTYVLVDTDGSTWLDALATATAPAAEEGLSFGRYPDADEDGFLMRDPSDGEANRLRLSTDVVINEIQYHPPPVAADASCPRDCSDADQWIELHNRSDRPADLSGWSLTKGVRVDFPPGTTIPGRGYLVAASSRARFLAVHPALDPAAVIGDWTRDLGHHGDTINLRDELGNRVDHVRYGDGTPLNDEEPRNDVDDRTFRGSDWPRHAQGSGASIELIHPELDNRLGAAWSEGRDGGTPGRENSVFDAAPAPVVGQVDHSPAVPRSSDAVTVTGRVSSPAGLDAVTAVWERDGGGAQGRVPLRDDGLAPDETAGDGIFAGEIPPQPDGAIVAFRIEAVSSSGGTSTFPLSSVNTPYDGFPGYFYLYQHLDAPPPSNPSRDYYVVMRASDLAELRRRPEQSDVLLPATFIELEPSGHARVRHLAGIRYRGEHSRFNARKSYRIALPPERTLDGIEDFNLNAPSIDNEILAADLFRRAGMPGPLEWTVNLTFNGELDSRYVRKERLGGDFLSRYYGNAADGGNLYRAFDPPGFPRQGDLSWLGEDPDTYRPYYDKRSNEEEDDNSDVIELCRTFDPGETPDDVFPDRLEAIADVWQWARYFALQSCIANRDGSIHSTTGEDFFLYRVPETSTRPDAGKWVLLPWDLEEGFSNRTEALFRPSLPSIRRFLRHPRFAPLYYCNLVSLRQGVFSRRETRRRFSLIDFLFGFRTIDGLDSFITARIGFYDENIPTALDSGTTAGRGTRIIAAGDTWRFFRGRAEPAGAALEWTLPGYDDSTWERGPSGFGYGDGDDATLLADMRGGYSTLYTRKTFEIGDPAAVAALALVIDYDDGFVAWINGTEVARRGLGDPSTPVAHDATARSHEAGTPERFDLGGFTGEIVAGSNVIAVLGVNSNLGSGDFSSIAELERGGGGVSAGCGRIVYTQGDTVSLEGRAAACATREVRVAGDVAEYDPVTGIWRGNGSVAPGTSSLLVEALDAFGGVVEAIEIEVRGLSGPLRRVGGDLTADTTWSAAEGPYLLSSDVVVPSGITLRIEPGTAIFGAAGSSLLVRGVLEAAGTAEAPIIFRALRCDARWGGITLQDTGTGPGNPTHLLRHVDIEFGDSPKGQAGCVAPVSSKLLVESSRFAHLTANAIDGSSARLEVRDSEFTAIHEGVHCARSTVIVLGSSFVGMVGDKDAIDFDGNGAERSRIESCLFWRGSDDGIDLGNTSVDIRDNVFVDIQDKALSLESNGPLGPPVVTGNIIYDCGTAIALKNGVTIREGHHNTVVGNQEGLNLFAKAGSSDGGHGELHSMILWHNTDDIRLDDRSTLVLTWSDVSDGVWPGEGNISDDPRLVSPPSGDFSLRPGSPAIGSGLDATDMGAVAFEGDPLAFRRGDADSSDTIELTDAVAALEVLFRGRAMPACQDRLDANDDGAIDISDPIRLLLWLFAGGPEPPAPFARAGRDPSADDLPCQ